MTEEQIRKEIGLRLKISRLQLEISQVEMANEIGIIQVQLSLIEKGKYKVSALILHRLAEKYSINPNYLLGFDTEPKISGNIIKMPSIKKVT